MVGVGDGRVVNGDVPRHPLPPLLAAVAALAGARPVRSEVRARHLETNRFLRLQSKYTVQRIY